MLRILRYVIFVTALTAASGMLFAQTTRWRDMHKVKKKETLYSICRDYGITMEELAAANPGVTAPDYKLKKGTVLYIPFSKAQAAQPSGTDASTTPDKAAKQDKDVRHRAIRLGVMLPLHDKNGDGRRMIEYYRGILMACDSLKKEGISIEVYAWNVDENDHIRSILADNHASQCDLIIGPLYSKQVSALSSFVEQHDIKLVIPFSIDAPEVYTNRHIFQIYQNQNELNESTARRFADWFVDYQPIIVDCGDVQSTKGPFTSAVRRMLEAKKISYSLTSLTSSDDNFRKAFNPMKPNVVLLNTSRAADMNVLFGKLSAVSVANPNLEISVFGYTEWMTQTNRQLENFYRYNTFIPSHFFTNQLLPATERLQQLYRRNFHQEMMPLYPRFALTGFDHAYFFLKGLHQYGKAFDGAPGRFGYPPVQTPLKFSRIGTGGMQNRAFMFVHYKPDHQVELINY